MTTNDIKKDSIKENIEKAEILIEALPYIQRFNGKVIVIKCGGSLMDDPERMAAIIEDVVLLKVVGFKPIIVHGGGSEISKWLKMSGKEPEFVDGLRVTDRDTMVVAQMVLNRFNKNLVREIQSLGVNAVGLSGADGGMLLCKKKMPGGKDIGYVGDIEKVDTDIIFKMLDDDYVPVDKLCLYAVDDIDPEDVIDFGEEQFVQYFSITSDYEIRLMDYTKQQYKARLEEVYHVDESRRFALASSRAE